MNTLLNKCGAELTQLRVPGKPRLHDLAVGREDEDETVEGLEEVRAELLEDLGASCQRRFHPPAIAQTC